MHIELFVEETSAEEALKNILPKIIGPGHSFRIHAFQGKHQLLKDLPSRLKGLKHWMSAEFEFYIVVLIDQDQEDCLILKAKLEYIARQQGFFTKTAPDKDGSFHVINRLAVEELEAWFFGDPDAIHAAYPRLPATITRKRPYRNPDAIPGGTWEALERELKRRGYYQGGMPKIEVARNISHHMDPWRNDSPSFRVFRDALLEIVS